MDQAYTNLRNMEFAKKYLFYILHDIADTADNNTCKFITVECLHGIFTVGVCICMFVRRSNSDYVSSALFCESIWVILRSK